MASLSSYGDHHGHTLYGSTIVSEVGRICTLHDRVGLVYAYEVDGFGNRLFMDDSNVPSLLALPYLGAVDPRDGLYRSTRQLVLSSHNPYFFQGSTGEGIGGPHVGSTTFGRWPSSCAD